VGVRAGEVSVAAGMEAAGTATVCRGGVEDIVVDHAVGVVGAEAVAGEGETVKLIPCIQRAY
jgi:hypothetical protein